MSLEELPGSLRVIFPAFSSPMKAERSRNKERLEASLAGLCELEQLKQRQECRVLSALCLGDAAVSGRLPWEALRSARCALDAPNGNALDEYGASLPTSSLLCTPWGIKSSLEQQVAKLKVNPEVKPAEPPNDLQNKRHSSGEGLQFRQIGSSDLNYHPAVTCSLSATEETGKIEKGESSQSDTMRQTTDSDAFREISHFVPSQEDYQQAQRVETYIFGLIQRRALPTRPSKSRTSLIHDIQTFTVLGQCSLFCKEEQYSPKELSDQPISTPSPSEETAPTCHDLYQECYLGNELIDETSFSYHHHYQLQSVQHESKFYHRPRKAWKLNSSRSTSPDYSPCSVVQPQQDLSNSETDSLHFHNYHPSPAQSKSQLRRDEKLVNAEYIPAQPYRAPPRAYARQQAYTHKSSGVHKPNQSVFSPERNRHPEEVSQIQTSKCQGGPKKSRMNEDKSGASRKPGKKACRSQSENSLQRVAERKYNTVERDGGESGSGGRASRGSQSKNRKQYQGSGSYRRWQSTLELSQDEAEHLPIQPPMQGSSSSNQRDSSTRRTRKFRSTHASYTFQHRSQNHHHNHPHHHQNLECNSVKDQMPVCKASEDYNQQGQGVSESSMTEADSPDSSSLSSDSDESCSLVWPQQLPPQLSLPSPPAPTGAPQQPKAFVKIKASHALKKKILRFRTGSLKVMTTV